MASASPSQGESLSPEIEASGSQYSEEVVDVGTNQDPSVYGAARFESDGAYGSYARGDIEIRTLIIKTGETELPEEVKLKFRESSFPNTSYCLDDNGKIEIRASRKIKSGYEITRHSNPPAVEIGQTIQKFMAITAVKNESIAKYFLTKRFWDCNATIDAFFDDRQGVHVWVGDEIPERMEKIRKFMEKTKNDEEAVAQFYLTKENWGLDEAVMMYNVKTFESDQKRKPPKF